MPTEHRPANLYRVVMVDGSALTIASVQSRGSLFHDGWLYGTAYNAKTGDALSAETLHVNMAHVMFWRALNPNEPQPREESNDQ